MNLRHLEVFCTVVECESFSAAAERLILTQPAVSMQVQAVERHFGVQLLDRRSRRTVLTEAGRLVYRWACEVLQSERETRNGVDELKHAQTGRVVVGASMTIGSHVLPPILSRFKREHVGAEIVVRLGERNEVCADLLSGSVDCAVLIAREIPPDLQVEVLGAEELVFICAPGHRFATRRRLCLEDLKAEPFIMAPRGSSYRRTIDELMADQGLTEISVLMELDGADGVKRAVQQGLGLGVALRSGVEWELEHGLLREVVVLRPRPLVEIGLVSRPSRQISPMVREFTSYLRDQLRGELGHGDQTREDPGEERPGIASGRATRRLAHHR